MKTDSIIDFEALSFAETELCAAFDAARFRESFSSLCTLREQLAAILHQRNGFYAYGGSLLFRPFGQWDDPRDIIQWNSPDLWISSYTVDLGDAVFFAEDVFGCQFCIKGNAIELFDPETGSFEHLAPDFHGLSEMLRSDANGLTGYPFLNEWSRSHGGLAVGQRLVPKLPFVCGGAFEIENLAAVGDVQGMLFRADLCNQIKDVPDGGKIVFRIADAPDSPPTTPRG